MGVDVSQLLLLVIGKDDEMKALQEKADLIGEELNIIIDLLYKQNKAEAYNIFNKTLVSIIEFIDSIYEYKKTDDNYNFDVNELANVLAEGLKAMEAEDLTLLADVLNYEVKELLIEAVKYE